MKRVLLVLTGVLVLSGCATVQPWERGNLARQEMGWSTNAITARFDEHVYQAKEAASGGIQAAGGGCGCN